MLEELLQYLRNWFVSEIYDDTYTIEDGNITLSFLQSGQYFRILGSTFNDGLYKYGDDLELTDETFEGSVWALSIPKALINIAAEIEAWQEKYGESVSGPYTSESFGGYSYTKASDATTGNAITWQSVFANRLAPYRKQRETSYIKPTKQQSPPYRRPFNPNYPWR